MDEIVKQAMAKWPDVPDVYGWLALDRRGRWSIKGERVSNTAIAEFMGRNYGHDAEGCWYFQNGPQRVFVALAYTPLVYRLDWSADTGVQRNIVSHNGRTVARVDSAWVDDQGSVILATEHGVGTVDDRDLERILPHFTDAHGGAMTEDSIDAAIASLQSGCARARLSFCYRGAVVPLSFIKAADAPARFGFVQDPVPPPGHQTC